MRISDWSSDVCSSDRGEQFGERAPKPIEADHRQRVALAGIGDQFGQTGPLHALARHDVGEHLDRAGLLQTHGLSSHVLRSEEHTSELQSLMRISYAVFCLKKKIDITQKRKH